MEQRLNAYGLDILTDRSQASGFQEDAQDATWCGVVMTIAGLLFAMTTSVPWVIPALILVGAGFAFASACHLGRRAAWEFEHNFLWNEIPD